MRHSLFAAIASLPLLTSSPVTADDLVPIALKSTVTDVQPMTGIVLWSTNEKVETAPIQLEYSYLTYSQVVREKGTYDWSAVETLLDAVARRKHQTILRWHDTYVGQPSGVPAYIQALPGYKGQTAPSEKKPTGFPDWSHPELRRFTLEFFTKFAERYDRDPRLAFVQVGFGLWSEYHIYDGPMVLGKTFPSLDYQGEFARHLAATFRETPWMISVDAAGDQAPYAASPELLGLRFGLFDDSFNHAKHKTSNEPNWVAFGLDRWKRSPTGGEFSFFEKKDQRLALAPKGPHGIPFADHAAKFHISFMIGDGQPDYQKPDVLRKAGLACGYRFEATRFAAASDRSEVTITNRGIAPFYYDAYPAVNGVRSQDSLRGLLPGESRTCKVTAGGTAPKLTIESDRLVPGQTISYQAGP